MRIRWHISTVETAGQSTWSSLAFSPSGQPAIAYYSSLNSALRFATLNPDGSWAISTVDTVVSDCKPSLAFRSGRPAISYRVGTNDAWGGLRFAVSTGGTPPWWTTSIDAIANASSLAFDSSQQGGISYYDPIGRTLKFARQVSPNLSNWVTETVDPQQNAGDFNALAFTPLSGASSGNPGDRSTIAYHDQAHNHIKFGASMGRLGTSRFCDRVPVRIRNRASAGARSLSAPPDSRPSASLAATTMFDTRGTPVVIFTGLSQP